MQIEDVLGLIAVVVLGPAVLFLVYFLFVIAPVGMYTEAECLRNGFPKSAVTVGLERYCMNLDGTVTVKVEKVSK